MARDRLPGVSFARSQSGGSGSGGPSARFPAGQPRRRRGPPRPASVPGLPRPHPREIATAAAPGPSGPAAAAAGWPHPRAWGVRGLGLSLPGGCHQVPSLGADLHGGRLHPPQLALQRRPARADRVRGSAGDTPPDRCRQARRRRACCCSWPAPGSYGAAPGQGPGCPLLRQAAPQPGRHYVVKQGKASADAFKSCSPLPTSARSRSDETTSSRR
jgi:hypothetical protein